MKWTRITSVEDIPLREGRLVAVGEAEIAVFNLGDRFLAVESRCPHAGGPLADGIVSGDTVICPLHAWRVCLTSGKVTKPAVAACVDTYPVRVENGILVVALPSGREVAA